MAGVDDWGQGEEGMIHKESIWIGFTVGMTLGAFLGVILGWLT
jgi:hypothetical protein